MKKVSTVAAKQSRNFSQSKLTIGLDLGDRSSWYFVLEEAGVILLEQRVSTTAKAMREVFGGMPHSRIALETGMHSPWVSRAGSMSEIGIFFANYPSEDLPTPRLSLTCPFQRRKISANDRPDHLALPHRREAGRRRDGCGLQS